MDMLNGPMMKNILLFALPIAAGGILQQLFTSADMAVIFWFEGTTAQAAVSSNGALVNLLINLFSGMSVGATVVVAELIGKNTKDDVHSVVFTSVVIAAVCGVILLGVGMGVASPLLELMDVPPEVLPLASEYLRIYFLGMPFLMVYNFGAAILRSVGDTVRPLIILLATGVLNLGLNVLTVAGMGMSVAGVALATVVANIASAAMVLWFLMRNDVLRMRKGSAVRAKYIKRIVRIGLPAGLQGAVFAFSNMFVQTAVNGFGDGAMAGNGNAVNFEMIVYFFVSGFAAAATTFYGQNFAAGKFDRCKTAYRLNLIFALIASAVLSAVLVAGGELFIRIYTTDPEAIDYALVRMRFATLGVIIPCFYEIPGAALRGMGRSMLPAVFTILGTCVFRIIWIYTVFVAVHEYWVLVSVYPLSWALIAVAMLISYYIISKRALSDGAAQTAAKRQTVEEERA